MNEELSSKCARRAPMYTALIVAAMSVSLAAAARNRGLSDKPFLWISGVLVLTSIAAGAWAFSLKRQVRERLTMESDFRDSRQRLQLALEAAELGTWRWIAAEQRVTWDASLSRMLGLTPAPASYSWSEFIERVQVDDRASLRAELELLIQTRETRAHEFRVVRPDGAIRWLRGQGRAFYTASGELAYVTGATIDVTDRWEAQETLRRAEARYRDVVENANDIVFTVDRDGHCLSMNRAGEAIAGCNPEEPPGMNLRDLVVPGQAEMAWQQLRRVLQGEEVPAFELEVVARDGRHVIVELAVRQIVRDGSVAVQGIARDVTRRKELEAQLQQAQKMEAVGQLAAGVAHDFNNLLTVILGNCCTSEPLVEHQREVRDSLDEIQAAAMRAAALTRQLLIFSRRQIVEPRVLSLNDVVTDIRQMLTRLISEDIELEFALGEEIGAINGDAGQLQQVIVNLAVNARDAMPNGGRLTIETRSVLLDRLYVQNHREVPPGEYAMLAVSDTGLGMDEVTRARLFEPFFTTKEAGKGTGLGLSTVYGIVKQSDGYIWVYSEPGFGSAFKIYFPRIHTVGAAAAAAPAHHEAPRGNEAVLLVEDEGAVRQLIETYLTGQGYAVLSAQSGEEALRLCRQQSWTPALLITDVVMPGMSGRTLAELLRAANAGLKVLYLSGYTDDTVIRRGILPGGVHFQQKPFALHAFAERVRAVLDDDAGGGARVAAAGQDEA
jgi:PAS domain S-box-containing protein